MKRAKPVEDAGTPSLHVRMRPLELLVISGVLGLFAGLVVFMGTREWLVAIIFFGIVFIVAVVALAMFALAFTPPDDKLPSPHDDEPIGH